MKINALLVRHRDGFSEFTDAASVAANGRKEGYLLLSEASEAEAQAIAEGTFAFAATDQWAVRLGLEPSGENDVPYTDFAVGDLVTAPGPDGDPLQLRVQALTVTEDGEGNVVYAPEVGDVLLDPQGRLRQWLERTGSGALGGRSKAAQPVGGGGGGSGGHAARPVLAETPTAASPVVAVSRTAGDIGVSATAWTDLNTGLDLEVPAVAGDWIAYHLSMFITPTAGTDTAVFNVVARTSAGQQGAWGAAESPTSSGVAAWYAASGTGTDPHIGGSVVRQVTADDIEDGVCLIRMRYRMVNPGSRTVRANADLPFQAYVVNHGQP